MEYLQRQEGAVTDTVYGFMSSLGKAFTAVLPTRSNGGTTEVPILLIKNPTGSGKAMRLHALYVAADGLSTNEELIVRAYTQPTITANGTVLTPTSNRPAKNVSSVLNVYSLPTISANGTKLFEFYTTTTFVLDGVGHPYFLDAGYSFLLTVQQSSSGINYTTDAFWSEITDVP